MPIYEYECGVCGIRHEALQKFADAPLRTCPSCGKPELVKLVSSAGFRLAGSGWYETDFKTGNKRNLAAAGSDRGDAKDRASPAQSSAQSGKGSAVPPTGKDPAKRA